MPSQTTKAALALTWRQASAIWWDRQGQASSGPGFPTPGSALGAAGCLHHALVPQFGGDGGRRSLRVSERQVADLPTFPYHAMNSRAGRKKRLATLRG